ncbi:hypothetical protein Tsubulata_006393 [Turnera subulata]|uniref:Helicase protein MOM1 n=1 Tax=Turnera subulata TaxID=218843 RepID=A0A9Q0EZC9_9ROSI|nr:hypothetical protein Tsubulata_006393 [Turnera subulata]
MGNLGSGAKQEGKGEESSDSKEGEKGLRRSSRFPMNNSPGPSGAIRSEQSPATTPEGRRKSPRLDNTQETTTLLRRSERGKNQSSPTAPLFPMKKKQKEKSVQQLNQETEIIDSGKRWDARAYRAIFKGRPNKLGTTTGRSMRKLDRGNSGNGRGDASEEIDSRDDRGESDEESLRGDCAGEDSEKLLAASNAKESKPGETNAEDSLQHPSQMHELLEESQHPHDRDGRKESVDDDRVLLSSNMTSHKLPNDVAERDKEVLQPRCLDHMHKGMSESETGLKSGCTVLPSKRKRDAVQVDFDTTAIASEEDIHISNSDARTSSGGCKSNNLVDPCSTCFKRPRVNHSAKQQEFCSCNSQSDQDVTDTCLATHRDRRVVEASENQGLAERCMDDMQDKDSCVDYLSDGCQNICLICKLGGKLLYVSVLAYVKFVSCLGLGMRCCYGKGCKRSYHLSCLDPYLKDVALGIWHCLPCVKKRMEVGPCEGVDSIWDAREVEVSDDNGLRRERQLFVKYKGLSHVHNQWVPETQLLLEAPSLVAEFNQKNQVKKWRQEWSVPHRLLLRRLLISPKQDDDCRSGHVGDIVDCHHEWLVKWCGLDYEHATWELETASFMKLPDVQNLKKDYVKRRKKFEGARLVSTIDKNSATKNRPLASRLLEFDNKYPNSGNNLYAYWQKQQSVVLDDQERKMKAISFILSLSSNVSSPFLIISSTSSLHSWDDELFRLAPSVYTVVYHGNRGVRESIRALEFAEESGGVMFQVLVTSPEIVIQDLNLFKSIKWEAMIVDECHEPQMHMHFEQFKLVRSEMRLLLVDAQLKDGIAEHLLSLLDCHSNMSGDQGLVSNSIHKIRNPKERLSKYIANGCKSDSSQFTEYWVPVKLSHMQLEQYCATLINHSHSLCSFSKDLVSSLQDALISTRKCCDHPYIMDPSLQVLLTKDVKDVNILDVGIKASGKLQLLNAMLSGIERRGRRVLVLFQSSLGCGKDNLGDILDDFVRQRFGQDSYERIDGGVTPARKTAALKNFNNQKERFVFLLETRACSSAIKLSSVDTVIIYGSDWSPMNDLRNLQKLGFESQQITVFRLYSMCTVEEKVLILSAQNKTLDSSLHNINRGTSHRLLMWGASYLFNRLAEFHCDNIPASSGDTLPEDSLLEDAIQEFSTILHQNGNTSTVKNSVILKVNQCRANYSTSSSLPGERKVELTDEELPQMFWKKLLEGKKPQWKYSSGSSQRSRKRVQHPDDSSKKVAAEFDEVVKKRKKLANNNIGPPSVKPALIGTFGASTHSILQQQPSAGGPSDIVHAGRASVSPYLGDKLLEATELNMVKFNGKSNLHDFENGLYLHLRQEMTKLCEVLQLPEDLKDMVERFLEFVMNNYQVNSEPVTIFQAFQISVCWTAASLLKHELDHTESLALAKQHLDFACKKEEADHIYSLLKGLKQMFLHHTGSTGMACSSGTAYLSQNDVEKGIKEIEKKCNKKMNKLLQKYQELKEELNRKYEEEMAKLELRKRGEEVVIRIQHNSSIGTDKLKLLDIEYEKKYVELKCQIEMQLKNIEEMQLAAMNKVQEKKDRWIQEVKSWGKSELSNKLPSIDSGRCQENTKTSSGELVPQQSHSLHDGDDLLKVADTVSSNEDGVDILPRACSQSISEHVLGGATDAILVMEAPSGVPQTVNSADGVENIASRASFCEKQASEAEIRLVASGGFSSHDGLEKNIGGSPEELDTNESAFMPPNREFSTVVSEIVQSSDGIASLNPPSKEQAPDECASHIHGVKPLVEIAEATATQALNGSISTERNETHAIMSTMAPETDCREGKVSTISDSGSDKDARGEQKILSEGLETSPVEVGDNANTLVNHVSHCLDESALNRPQHGSVSSEAPEIAFTGRQQAVESGELQDGTGRLDKNVENQDDQFVYATTGVNELVGEVPSRESSGRENGAVCVTASCSVGGEQHDREVPSQIFEHAPGEVVGLEIAQRESDGLCDDDTGSYKADGAGLMVDQDSHPQELLSASENELPLLTASTELDNRVAQVVGEASENEFPLLTTSTGLENRVAQSIGDQNALQQADISTTHPGGIQSDTDASIQHMLAMVVPATDPCSSTDALIIASAGGTEPQPTIQMGDQADQADLEPVASSLQDVSTEVLLTEPGTCVSDTRTLPVCSGANVPPAQTSSSVQMPSLLSGDPLQNELERIQKEKDQRISIHEDMKLRLKLDCEKEIQDAIAQIRAKYESKYQDLESEFIDKNKELDSNHNKVLMNKILAEAFRSKCMDIKASSAPGKQQEMASTFVQQLLRLSSQPTAQRPPRATGLSSSNSLGSLQTIATTPPPRLAVQKATAASSTPSRPPHISSFLPAGSSFQVGSEIRAPAPHIGSVLPATSNLQVGSGIRAPAPHLQPFRTPTLMPATGLSSFPLGVPSQQVHGNFPTATAAAAAATTTTAAATTTTAAAATVTAATNTVPAQQLPSPLPPCGHESGLHNRADRSALLQPVSIASQSVNMTVDVDNLTKRNPFLSSLPLVTDSVSNSDPQVPDSVSNSDPQVPSELGLSTSMVNTSVVNTVAGDVVCLSDDD